MRRPPACPHELLDVRRRSSDDNGGLVESCAVEGAGVLDCSWLPVGASRASGCQYLAVATSACDARLYAVEADGGQAAGILTEVGTMACDDAGDA